MPQLGPFIVSFRAASPESSFDYHAARTLYWCYIELNAEGHVTGLSMADPAPDATMPPPIEHFSAKPIKQSILCVLDLANTSANSIYCFVINKNYELIRFRLTEGLSSIFMPAEIYNGKIWRTCLPVISSHCNVLLLPSLEAFDALTMTANASYVRVENKLFYINKGRSIPQLVELTEAQFIEFDAEINPSLEPKLLTSTQLKKITSITGHKLRQNALGVLDTEHLPFIVSLDTCPSSDKPQTLKEILIAQYHTSQAATDQALVKDSDWLITRQTLAVSWINPNKKLQQGLEHGGFLNDWRNLKHETASPTLYCLALMSVLASPELYTSIITKLNDDIQTNVGTLRRYLQKKMIMNLYSRWIAPPPGINTISIPTIETLQAIHKTIVTAIFCEFEQYQCAESDEQRLSFRQEDIAPLIVNPEIAPLTERDQRAAILLDQYINNPIYRARAALDVRRAVESTLQDILNREQTHWGVYEFLILIDDEPELDERMRKLCIDLGNQRRKEIQNILVTFSMVRAPESITETEQQSIKKQWITTPDDLVAGLKGSIGKQWKPYLINLIKPGQSSFIKTARELRNILEILDTVEQNEAILQDRTPEEWLRLIQSANDIVDLFIHLSVPQKERLLKTATNTWTAHLLTYDTTLLKMASIFNTKQLKKIFSVIPQNTPKKIMQTPMSMKALLSFSNLKVDYGKISIILNAIEEPYRITAIATLDALNDVFSSGYPALKTLYLESLTVMEWDLLLEKLEDGAWPILRGALSASSFFEILNKLPLATWLVMFKHEIKLHYLFLPASESTNDLFDFLLCCANKSKNFKRSVEINWDELKVAIQQCFAPKSSPHLFPPPQPTINIELQRSINTAENVMELKHLILTHIQSVRCHTQLDHFFHAAIIIKAYDNQIISEEEMIQPCKYFKE